MSTIMDLLNKDTNLPENAAEHVATSRSIKSSPKKPKIQHLRKKVKLSKDIAIFTAGEVRGECRYPPHEAQTHSLKLHHSHFEVYPMGQIRNYPRHIPYSSEKKTFLERTGRDSLEVFQYQFKVPGEDRTYYVLWDYNIGLVRTTPLFKCMGHPKTTPAKVLNQNPGLAEICYSITGGALVAQGYWMPFEAAKTVAAAFCWKIRYALTPVFGHAFPSECIHPNSDKFCNMLIDPAITARCAEQTRAYRELEAPSISRSPSTVPRPITPDTPTHPRCPRSITRKRPSPNTMNYYTSPRPSDIGTDDGQPIASIGLQANLYKASSSGIKSCLYMNSKHSLPVLPRPVITSMPMQSPDGEDDLIRVKSASNSLSQQIDNQTSVDSGYDGDVDEVSRPIQEWADLTYPEVNLLSDEDAAHILLSLRYGNLGT